tara:strand:- start:230 stop:460 length:231 start_codon:yes stop_codon:yes gene_type:complete
MCREVVKKATNWWVGTATGYNSESQRAAWARDEELEAFTQSYLAMRMEINPDAQAAQRRLEAISPRSLVSYFDLVA